MPRSYERHPIREGCYVEFVQTLPSGYQRICVGHVTDHFYGENGNHCFTITSPSGNRSVQVLGVILYSNLLKHIPSEKSQIDERRAKKRDKKREKRYRRKNRRSTRGKRRGAFSQREHFESVI